MLVDAKDISSFAAFEGKLYFACERDSYSLCINSRVSKELLREDKKIKYLQVYKPSPYSSYEVCSIIFIFHIFLKILFTYRMQLNYVYLTIIIFIIRFQILVIQIAQNVSD